MSRMEFALLGMVVGVLAGCAKPADPAPSGVASANAATAPGPRVVAPTEAAAASGSAIVIPIGPSAPDGTTMSQFTSTPVAGLPQCNQYSVTATVDGKQQPLNGEACRQPDGSWHIAEQPVGEAGVYQTVYWPPAEAAAYDDCFDYASNYPCLYDFPFGFSIGFPVFIDVHHHFHPFNGIHGPADDRFGHLGHIEHFDGHTEDFGHGFRGAGGHHQ